MEVNAMNGKGMNVVNLMKRFTLFNQSMNFKFKLK